MRLASMTRAGFGAEDRGRMSARIFRPASLPIVPAISVAIPAEPA